MAPLLFKFNLSRVFNSMVLYLYKINSFKDIKLHRLYIFPSAKCNDFCIYCKKKEERYEMEFFENRSLIDHLIVDTIKLGIREIHFFGGGEPFFYKDNMFYFLENMRDIDTFIKIITNGNNLNDKDIQNIVKNGLISHLSLNLNTDSPEMARNVYLNNERHNQTLSILESISKYKKLYNKQFPLVDIFFVLFNMNFNKIPNIISLLKRFDISFFFIQPLRRLSEFHDNLKLSDTQMNEFEQMLPSIEKIMSETNIRSNLNDFKINKNLIKDSGDLKCVVPDRVIEGKTKLGCYVPLTTLSIYSDGTIPKCIYSEEAYQNNYFSLSSLRDFINNGEFIDFLMKFIESEDLSFCKNCSICLLCEIEEIKKRLLHFKQMNISI